MQSSTSASLSVEDSFNSMIERQRIELERGNGMIVVGAISMLFSSMYIADGVCGDNPNKMQQANCAGYVISSWVLVGGIAGRVIGPPAHRFTNYLAEEVAAKVSLISNYLFGTDANEPVT